MSPQSPNPLAVEHALLGLLQAGPLHGYALYRQLSDPAGLGAVWHIKQAHLYGLLARLETQALVTSQQEPQLLRPARKVLCLTPDGLQAFSRWVVSPVTRGRDLRVEFLAKLFFAQQAGPAATARLVEAQRQALQGWLAARQSAAPAGIGPATFARLVEQYRQGQIAAMLAWLQALEHCPGVDTPPGTTRATEY